MFFKKKIAVIGSTGSIGTTTLKIIKKYPNLFNVELLACNKSLKKLISQIKLFSPKYIFISDILAREKFKKLYSFKNIKLIENFDCFSKIFKKHYQFDKVILGASSMDGLKYSFEFINYSKEILVANKESIICGGNVLLKAAKKLNCKISSIDSELYSLSQLLLYSDYQNIDTVYLTASGGPFLGKKKKSYMKSSVRLVTNHPRWLMGKKISVDSSTMVNKIFEVIETHILFRIPFNKIKIKIHKESLVHSVVIFKNGFVKAGMHDTSMEIPIRNSLFENGFSLQKQNFFKNKNLVTFNFNEIQLSEFPILKTGLKIINLGHAAWILFNVINDELVKKFLNKQIFYYEIVKNLNKIFLKKNVLSYCKKKISTFDDIEKAINFGLKEFKIL